MKNPGACTMMVAEQTQGYRISFELTKPNQSNRSLSGDVTLTRIEVHVGYRRHL